MNTNNEKNEKDLKENCLYFDITTQERDSAIRYLLGAIIKSRRDSNFPSNYYTFDEDVNVYLAHLLFAVALPEYHEMAEPYLSLETSDILQWVRASEDHTIRYFIFKVNADHILIHTGIFDDLVRRPRQPIFKRSLRYFRELAQLYYDQAALYHSRIYRKKTGVGEVLEKLSRYFEPYQETLQRVRREYFNFVTGFRDQVFHHFIGEFKRYEDEYEKRAKTDQFLELYGQWLDTKNPILEGKITALVAEIKRLDPAFGFDPVLEFQRRRFGNDERKCA